MASEGDKLLTLINRMAEIETEQPTEKVVEMDPAEQAREELEQAVSQAKNVLVNYMNSMRGPNPEDGIDANAFKTEAEEILFDNIMKELAELEERMRGPQ
jgi:hypothetical protein